MSTPPSSAVLMQMLRGYWVSQAISVAARLRIADLLEEGPKSSDELASIAGVHARSLYRLLRALASVDVFFEDDDSRFGLTPLSECLRSGIAGSLRAPAIMLGQPWIWGPWGDLSYSVQTGEPASPHVLGAHLFDYLPGHPDAADIFNDAMTALSAHSVAAVANAYDFSQFGKVVDVGGGHGALLSAILKAAPRTRGVLFDLPAVVRDAQLEAADLADRTQIIAGNMFEQLPAGGDAYVLKNVIHDWNDGRGTIILKNCRRAMTHEGRLLIVEMVLSHGDGAILPKWMDLHMLVQLGGQERTEEEYRALLAASGFRLTRILPTESPQNIIEAVPE